MTQIDKQSATGLSDNGPRYQWDTDKGKNKGRNEAFGQVMDMGDDPKTRGSAVLVYGPYTGRNCVSKAAQVASEAARVLNQGGPLPQGEPVWLDSIRYEEDEGVINLRQQMEAKLSVPNLKKYSLMAPTVGPNVWCGERMHFETTDGELFRVTVERVR